MSQESVRETCSVCSRCIKYISIAPAGLVSRKRTYLKPKQRTQTIHYNVPSCKWAMHFISLNIRLVIFMLLVVAGDVERNPGPPKSRMSEGEGNNLSPSAAYT